MSWRPQESTLELSQAIQAYDQPRVGALCDELIRHLRITDATYDRSEAERILDQLRRKRHFHLMQCVADALIQSGQDSWRIRRQYAQSQLDLGNMTAAINTLIPLIADTAAVNGNGAKSQDPREQLRTRENAEARGLLGRAYKQLYIDAGEGGVTRNRRYLEIAFTQYRDVYASDPAEWLWHGINSVALLRRAERDGVDFGRIADPKQMAQSMATEILVTIRNLELSGKAGHWDFATAVEACVALDLHDEALKWLVLYLGDYTTDAFELASTRRQLLDVWRLSPDDVPGNRLLPQLDAALLRAPGGSIAMTPAALARESIGEGLEKILGDTGLKTLKWFRRGIDRARSVGRVRKQSDGRPLGTGFLLRGEDLVPGLGEALVFLTNSHVVSDPPERGALGPAEAVLHFELVDKRNEGVKPSHVIGSSHELDFTLLALQPTRKSLKPVPISPARPTLDGKQRAYIIGHPQGRDLEISLQDNLILDADDAFVHYRSPTEPGSSGSPVFNEDWACIGLHHAGKRSMPRLHGEGTYPANEGIWLDAIKRDLRRHAPQAATR